MRARNSFAAAALFSTLIAAAPAFAQDAPIQPPPTPAPPAPVPAPVAAPAGQNPASSPANNAPPSGEAPKGPKPTPVIAEARVSGGGGGRVFRPKKKVAAVMSNSPIATYPGFRVTDAGSRVLVEISRKVDVSEHKAQGRVTYRLKGVAAPTRTNRLPLLTGFFATTPVNKIQLVEASGDVDLVIELRAQSDATFKTIDTTKGGIVLQIDFPKLQGTTTVVAPNTTVDTEHVKRGTDTTRIDATSAY